jgi:hypothetical protein
MTFLLTACTAPVTNIIGPLYHLIRGDRDLYEGDKQSARHEETKILMFALLRTVTVAALLFTSIPFVYFFGFNDDLGPSLSLTAQFLIHPYAAALTHGFLPGGLLLIKKVADLFVKRQLIFTRDDAADFATSIMFCYIAQLIDKVQNHGFLDRQYRHWSKAIANRFFPQPKRNKHD